MATIGVLTYTLPHGLKLKNPLNKFNNNNNNSNNNTNNNSNNVNNNNNNNSNNNNNNNTIVTKVENIGMISSEVVVMRKKQKLIPLTESNTNNVQYRPIAKRPKLSENAVGTIMTFNASPSAVSAAVAKKQSSNPLPTSVARRNARERNRVKQVNNGFACLRQHIPDEVAIAFEAAGNGRGNSKKLSKVETLRMAVEYIRSLERLLELDTGISSGQLTSDNSLSSSSNDTATVIKTESCSSSIIDDHYSESNYDPEESTVYFTDTLPDITTVNGQQYLRIPGTNTYQLITSDISYENEENIQPIPGINYNNISLDHQLGYVTTTTTAATGTMNTTVQQNSTTLTTTNTLAQVAEILSDQIATTIITPAAAAAPISPSASNRYVNGIQLQAASPADGSNLLQQDPRQQQEQQQHDHHQNLLAQLQQMQHHHQQQQHQISIQIKNEESSPNIYSCHLAPSPSPLGGSVGSGIGGDNGHNLIDARMYDGITILKRKIKEENVILDTTGISEESMMEAIDWWDSHTHSDDSVNL